MSSHEEHFMKYRDCWPEDRIVRAVCACGQELGRVTYKEVIENRKDYYNDWGVAMSAAFLEHYREMESLNHGK